MLNELLFVIHAIIVTLATIIALRISPHFLVTLISVQYVLMNFLVTKEITLFGLQATATDAYAIGITLGFNLLQEYVGQRFTQRAIGISFAISLYATLITQLHLWYAPSLFDTHHQAAQALLGTMPRIIAASLISYLIVQMIDLVLFAFLKILFTGKYLPARAGISLLVSQLLDTIIFSFLGLYGIVSSISSIIMVSYTVKVCAIAISVPLVAMLKPLLKHSTNEF